MGIPPLPDVIKIIFSDVFSFDAIAGTKDDISPSAPSTGFDKL